MEGTAAGCHDGDEEAEEREGVEKGDEIREKGYGSHTQCYGIWEMQVVDEGEGAIVLFR